MFPTNFAGIKLPPGAGSAGNGDINTSTDKALTFHGAPSVNIPPGEVILSDPFDYDLPALTNLAVSIYFGNISATTINGHPGSRTTSYISASNLVAAPSMAGAATTAHWYIITGVEVLTDASSKAVVTLGDVRPTDGSRLLPEVGILCAWASTSSKWAMIRKWTRGCARPAVHPCSKGACSFPGCARGRRR